MLHFGSSDAEGKGSERPVSGSMGIPAHDGRTREGQSLLRAHHMDNPLARVTQVEQRHSEILTVLPQGFDLLGGNRVLDRLKLVSGRNVVIRNRKSRLRNPYLSSCHPESLKGLRRGHLMDQMAVDVEDTVSILLVNQMGIPDFFKKGFCHDLSLISGLT